MLIVIDKPATPDQIQQMAKDYEGYIKFVVDVEQRVIVGGGQRHVEGEEKLLAIGSKQGNLWGGGIDLETKEIDYNSMINLRPNQGNPSRDVLSIDIRNKIGKIVKKLFSL